MKVKFIKDHFVGIKQGEVKELKDEHAQNLIDEGFCEVLKKPRKKKED